MIPDPNPTLDTTWPLHPAGSIILTRVSRVSRVSRNPNPNCVGRLPRNPRNPSQNNCTPAGKEVQKLRTKIFENY